MQKLNNLSTKSVILISFLLGVLIGGSALFYVTYSPFTQASSQEIQFEATAYEDLVRFKVEGSNVSKVQVEIYDLSGRKIYQGETTRQALDWHRTTDNGERLTKGTYLYITKAFNRNNLVKTSGIGKMFISPKSVQLQTAPTLESPVNFENEQRDSEVEQNLQIMAYDHDGTFTISDSLGVGTENPERQVHVKGSNGVFRLDRDRDGAAFLLTRTARDDFSTIWKTFSVGTKSSGVNEGKFVINDLGTEVTGGSEVRRLTINNSGLFGIGTKNPSANLEVHGSSSNLLALYNPNYSTTSAKFRVESDGTVRADGTYYGADFKTGEADIAEKVNMSEWVEKGQLVEIHPEHEGYFRKTKSSYSTRVAGVISTNPGVTLGNNNGTESSDWDDTRPSVALAGRVPVKVTAENGPIEIGDTLTSSSRPGFGMKCREQSKCAGTVVGKAMEPLEKQEGTIMVQVSLN